MSALDELKALRASVMEKRSSTPSPKLAAYLEKVRTAAHTIDDAEVRALGADDDEIFERTIGAAMAVGIARYEAGLRALEENDE